MKLNLYNKFLRFLNKKGKINKARFILNKTFFYLYTIFNKPVFFLFNTFFSKLNIFVETRFIRIRRARYAVPFVIGLRRRVFIILKWFFMSLRQNKKKKPYFFKMAKEIYNVLKNIKNKTVDMKLLNVTKALQNRSNIHYRW